MSPNDSGGEDDFVLVDAPVRNASSEDVIGESPFENDYVTVHANDLIEPATQDTPTAPPLPNFDKNVLKMEKFEPIFMRMFPKELKQVVLMAPLPTTDQALNDEINKPPRASHHHKILINNAILLFQCFLHFMDLYPKIGRDFMVYTVARACEVDAEDIIILHQLVDRTIRMIARSREMFLVMNQDFSLPNAEDSDVRELAWLADSYIYFLPPEEPHRVKKNWHEDEAVDTLWREWQDILKKKGLRVNGDKINTAYGLNTGMGHKRGNFFSHMLQAFTSLADDANLLEISRCSFEITQSEMELFEAAMTSANRLRGKFRQLRRQLSLSSKNGYQEAVDMADGRAEMDTRL